MTESQAHPSREQQLPDANKETTMKVIATTPELTDITATDVSINSQRRSVLHAALFGSASSLLGFVSNHAQASERGSDASDREFLIAAGRSGPGGVDFTVRICPIVNNLPLGFTLVVPTVSLGHVDSNHACVLR